MVTDSAEAYLAKPVSTKNFKFLFDLIKLSITDSYSKISTNNVDYDTIAYLPFYFGFVLPKIP
jgi:hypothetical protein